MSKLSYFCHLENIFTRFEFQGLTIRSSPFALKNTKQMELFYHLTNLMNLFPPLLLYERYVSCKFQHRFLSILSEAS